MGVFEFSLFIAATFAAALVASIAGFAFAFITAAVWLYALPPSQAVPLLLAYAFLVQGYGVWKLRASLSWERLWPFLLGGAPGIALGILLLRWLDPSPATMRHLIGLLLVSYAIYSLTRPAPNSIGAGKLADFGVGCLSGVLGPLTGFPGVLITIWSGHRGWTPDVQRAVFQPAMCAMVAMCTVALGVNGSIVQETFRLFAIGLPALIAGTWLGFKVYSHFNQADFRKAVLILLLVSGLPLVVDSSSISSLLKIIRPTVASALGESDKVNEADQPVAARPTDN